MEQSFNISSYWSGRTEGWHIALDGEQVHFAKSIYERDMFIAELRARLKLLQQREGL